MAWLLPLVIKSLLVAGGALLLLRLLKERSAADRSWIAHLALGGLLLLPVATFILPTLDVAGPEWLVGKAEVESPSSALPPVLTEPAANPSAAAVPSTTAAEVSSVGSTAIDWPFWGYAGPAALLVLFTLVALGRLFILKARATVLVDAPWLTALARAQQRMGFKHGTALLTSDELPSPISWGVVRPVILLNSEAALSHGEAEAIITHELAHVARLDWAKLLLSRVAVALFWFNPFVWLLAREAHQLREEAADDAVLATDIDETEYAKLLVGVARHECRGFLIGAHGVAPARNSLARRVTRVLDRAVRRAPGGWRWGSAAAFFAAGMAVPVAALNLVPVGQGEAARSAQFAQAGETGQSGTYYTSSDTPPEHPALPAPPEAVAQVTMPDGHVVAINPGNGGTITHKADGRTVMVGPSGGTIEVYPPDSHGHRRTVLIGPSGQVVEYADARGVPGMSGVAVALGRSASAVAIAGAGRGSKSAADRAIELKAVGVTPEYIAAIRAAVPQLNLDHDAIVEMKAVGVTPAFIQELARLGYRNVDADDLVSAYAVGVREEYVRSLANAGYGRLSLDQLTELRAVGVTARDIQAYRRAGNKKLDVDKLTELKSLGISPEELKASEDFDP